MKRNESQTSCWKWMSFWNKNHNLTPTDQLAFLLFRPFPSLIWKSAASVWYLNYLNKTDQNNNTRIKITIYLLETFSKLRSGVSGKDKRFPQSTEITGTHILGFICLTLQMHWSFSWLNSVYFVFDFRVFIQWFSWRILYLMKSTAFYLKKTSFMVGIFRWKVAHQNFCDGPLGLHSKFPLITHRVGNVGIFVFVVRSKIISANFLPPVGIEPGTLRLWQLLSLQLGYIPTDLT